MSFYRLGTSNNGVLFSPTGLQSVVLGVSTAPAAFTAGQWGLAPITNGLRISVTALPVDGGQPISSLQYRLNAGAWVAMAGTGLGDRDVTGLPLVLHTVEIRAVNTVGAGAASDTKSATPTAATGPVVNEGASTGVTFTTVNIGGTDYRFATYNSSGTLVVTTSGQVDYLVVGGGGSGGGTSVAGGGGGGGVRRFNAQTIGAGTLTVTVGAGGVVPTLDTNQVVGDGGNSSFNSHEAEGGGCGGARDWSDSPGRAGGSGGGGGGADGGTGAGAGAGNTPTTTPSQGSSGGAGIGGGALARGGGGGGAGATGGAAVSGGQAGNGGSGASDDITGTSVLYGAGGGGGGSTDSDAGSGGSGGGGRGASSTRTSTAGTANTGSGGGGGGHGGVNVSSNGGSGVVIIRWVV